MRFDPTAPPPLATAALPGVGGVIRVQPEDFEVEEIPAYQPAGRGDFLYLWLEKRAIGAEYFTRQVARRLGVAAAEVGCAGLKDRHAVTRQMVSVPARAGPRLSALDGDGIRLLRVDRHTNKLRPGHLRGNRFRVLIRGPDGQDAQRLPALMAALRRDGLPNFYGPQRFGRDGETVQLGLDLLATSRGPHGGRRAVRSPFLRKLALSAAQSSLFNHYLAARVQDGLFGRVLLGDVMLKRPHGGPFVAADVAAEQARFDGRATVHSGPIFGRKMFRAAAEAAAREEAALTDAGLTLDAFAGFGKLLLGTRRANLVHPDDLTCTVEPAGVRLSFSLPAGSYATVLLNELMKSTELALGGEED